MNENDAGVLGVYEEQCSLVDIDTLVPHPSNPNKMPEERMAKVERNIRRTRRLPRIIVRGLANSAAFAELHAQGKLQIVDGEHRWLIAQRIGFPQVPISNWGNLSDEETEQFLLTINELRGDPNKDRRRQLIRGLVERTGDPEAVAAILPEDVDEIVKIAQAEAERATAVARKRADELAHEEPLTVFTTPAQQEIIRRAIKTAIKQHGIPDDASCREGEALRLVCAAFLGEGV